MCLAVVGAVVSAVGTLASAAAASAQARAQQEALNRQALMESQRGAYESQRQKDANTRKLAGMRGQYLSSGVALSGSALDVLTESATEASLDEQAILYGAKVRSDNLRYEAKIAGMNAKHAMIGGALGAFGDVLGGVTRQRAMNENRTMLSNPYEF